MAGIFYFPDALYTISGLSSWTSYWWQYNRDFPGPTVPALKPVGFMPQLIYNEQASTAVKTDQMFVSALQIYTPENRLIYANTFGFENLLDRGVAAVLEVGYFY
jgi:hypothetical protein